jgi:hypothetical protein
VLVRVVSRVPAHDLKHMSSLLSLTRAHRRDSPIPPRARHFISDTLLQAIPQHRSRPVCMSHRASRRMLSATRSVTMFYRRPYGVAQALGSVVERSGKILICCCPAPARHTRRDSEGLVRPFLPPRRLPVRNRTRRVCASLHSYTSICATRFVQANIIGKRSTIRRIQ